MVDAIALARTLIQKPSVTPADAGAIEVLQRTLTDLGFVCRRLRFGAIENLYARRGSKGPNLCFAGHTDVVPVGEAAAWTQGPFAGSIVDGKLYGRGAADMKGAIAAFVAAVARTIERGEVSGSLSLLITGDEEGVAVDGTKRVVETLAAEGEIIDHCIVGEPSSAAALGDMIKVGRRGSVNIWIEVLGVQGHVAYPDRAANPIPMLVKILDRLCARRLDDGYVDFQPSNLEVTDIAVGNEATNIIPAKAEARLNIRFNPNHTGASLVGWVNEACAAAEKEFAGQVRMRSSISGEAFLTEAGAFTHLAAAAVEEVVGLAPELSTTGGTSDARFIRALCPVIELGLVGSTMHQVDEHVEVDDIYKLVDIYERILSTYFISHSNSGS